MAILFVILVRFVIPVSVILVVHCIALLCYTLTFALVYTFVQFGTLECSTFIPTAGLDVLFTALTISNLFYQFEIQLKIWSRLFNSLLRARNECTTQMCISLLAVKGRRILREARIKQRECIVVDSRNKCTLLRVSVFCCAAMCYELTDKAECTLAPSFPPSPKQETFRLCHSKPNVCSVSYQTWIN